MTFQLKQGKHFDPVGWDLVREEAINKQERLQEGSTGMVGMWQKNSNWGFFQSENKTNAVGNGNGNGFQDPYDTSVISRQRFPQRPF